MTGPRENLPSISIVTISYNQGRFLKEAMESVADQNYPRLEYIVVDPGSTDGSRTIIREFDRMEVHRVLTPDRGPAEGLNKGFALATGELLGFLNADDYLLPGALRAISEAFRPQKPPDVVSGHCLVVDENGLPLRRSFSDVFELTAFAYGASVLMQPSTFFTRRAFRAAGGFNPENSSAWDGELWVRMGLLGYRFAVLDRLISAFRVHPESISGSSRLAEDIRAYQDRMFLEIKGRPRRKSDEIIRFAYLLRKYMRDPEKLIERVRFGPLYGRYS